MNYCTNCGTANEGNKNFCSNCGQSLTANTNMSQVSGQVVVGKQKNGKATASLVLGIIAVVWAAMSMLSFGQIEEALVEAMAESTTDNVFAAKMGFFIGYNIVSLPCGIIGLILGLRAKKNGKALAGIVTSLAALAIATISLFIIIGVEL